MRGRRGVVVFVGFRRGLAVPLRYLEAIRRGKLRPVRSASEAI
jgi:hypothetical protein